ncbi:unnamed protein product [Thlaspi arvense]|uniref:Uncharacterized protein n=1 Tax=Thlaspi arvense TaxID=13288 RepID=A0AAU9SUY8_THLAR|nr:unnamed protein product [Thlaspi arvense]
MKGLRDMEKLQCYTLRFETFYFAFNLASFSMLHSNQVRQSGLRHVLKLSGGPGCSSTLDLFMENKPVHDAGHMVPMDQPKAPLEMLQNWMQGKLAPTSPTIGQ